jgi:DnaJ-class molecular chaperone
MTDKNNEPLLPLEEHCSECYGKGGDDQDGTGWHRCGVCNGSGYEPTELGEAILTLVRHNLEPMLQDIGR